MYTEIHHSTIFNPIIKENQLHGRETLPLPLKPPQRTCQLIAPLGQVDFNIIVAEDENRST